MVLQAFFDDSKTDGAVLVLGGYIATAERWAHFADEWKDVLSIRPAWRRFKASEVCASRDEVTRERVRCHYKVIRDHVLADVCVAIPLDAFKVICDEFSLVGADANPYFFAWNSLISALAHNASKLGIRDPVELYFDAQSEKTKILLAWDNLERRMPRRWREIIKGMPSFKDDDEVMPLQAADFAAWWLRRAYVESGTLDVKHSVVPWEKDPNAYGHLYGQTDVDRIRLGLLRIRESVRLSLGGSMLLPTYAQPFDWSRYQAGWRRAPR